MARKTGGRSAVITDAELQGLGAQALNMALRDMDRGQFNFLLASYHGTDTPPFHRMDKIEKLIVERLGEKWLNSGSAKDIGFNMLRMAVSLLPPDALVIVTMINRFKPTAKLAQLPEAKQREVLDTSHDRHHQAVKDGLLEVCDSLFAIAQTPERVCQYVQDFNLHGKTVSKPDVMFGPQEQFSGRLKMFES
jgi:hypothetical protein